MTSLREANILSPCSMLTPRSLTDFFFISSLCFWGSLSLCLLCQLSVLKVKFELQFLFKFGLSLNLDNLEELSFTHLYVINLHSLSFFPSLKFSRIFTIIFLYDESIEWSHHNCSPSYTAVQTPDTFLSSFLKLAGQRVGFLVNNDLNFGLFHILLNLKTHLSKQ